MKNLRSILFLFILSFSVSSVASAQTLQVPQAQKTQQDKPADEDKVKKAKQAVGQLIDHYATVAGGYYLERKCKFLPENVEDTFDEHMIYSTIKMKKVVGLSNDMLIKIDNAARDTAATTSCDAKGKSIAIDTFNMAGDVVKALAYLQRNVPRSETVLK